MRRRFSLALLSVLFGAAALAETEVPFLAGRVVDLANILTPATRESLDTKLAGLEQRTGAQLVVLTVSSLEGEPIERYTYRVASAWKLGQEDQDNGVLLLVAPGDRKMRVEVGRGLEPVLTDLETNIVQTEVIIPHFKQNDFSGGIEAGVDALIQGIEGEVQPAPQPAREGRSMFGGAGWPFALFGLFFLWPFAREAARSGSWFLYAFLMPFFFFLGLAIGWPFPLITLGAWVVLFPILRKILPKTPKRGGGSGGGWWTGLGGGGSSWSSGGGGWSSGGGGGFSGGGGSFGGGGSSSSW